MQPATSASGVPSRTMFALGLATMRMKSKWYLSGLRNTYELLNWSIGGTMTRLGSPPGRSDGTLASAWLGETVISITGWSLSSMKWDELLMLAKAPRAVSENFAALPLSVVLTLAPAGVVAITRKYS